MFNLTEAINENGKQILEDMWDIVLQQNKQTTKDFMEKYGFSSEDTQNLYNNLSKRHYYSTRSTTPSYDNYSYRYTEAYEKYKKEVEKQLLKLALQKTITEIPVDEISEELLDILYQKGYDGKSGSAVLQSMYKLYCDSKGKDEKILDLNKKIENLQSQNDSLKSKNAEVQSQNDNLKFENYDLKSKNSRLSTTLELLTNIVRKQSSYITTIRGLIQNTHPSLEQLKTAVNPKNFIEGLKSLFSRKYQQKRLIAPNDSISNIEQTIQSIGVNCDNAESFKTQNMPDLSEVLAQNELQRLGSNEIERRTDMSSDGRY